MIRVWAWTTSWWDGPEQAAALSAGTFGLLAWQGRVQHYLSPTHTFIACGTWSNPTLNPLHRVPTINAGIPQGTPYDIYYNHLWLCAVSAAAAYALNHRESWDLLVLLDTDALIGAVDFDALLREFMARSEVMLAQAWGSAIGGPLYVWKPEGILRLLHCRHRPNLLPVTDKKAPKPPTAEEELLAVFRDAWWNPWPQHSTMRQDHGLKVCVRDNAAVLKWPMVRLPDPAIIDEYTRTQTSQAKPLIISS